MFRFFIILLVASLASASTLQAQGDPITPQNASSLQVVASYGRGEVRDLEWTSDSQQLAVATARGVWLYDRNLESPPSQVAEGNIYSIALSPNNTRMVVGLNDLQVIVSQMENTTPPITLQLERENTENKRVEQIDFSPDGRFVAMGASRNVYVFDTQTGAARRLVQDVFPAFTFLPDREHEIMVAKTDGTAFFIINVDTNEIVQTIDVADQWQYSNIHSMASSPDGRRVLVSGFFSNATMPQLAIVNIPADLVDEFTPMVNRIGSQVHDVAWSTSRLQVGVLQNGVLQEGNPIYVWDGDNYQVQWLLDGHSDSVTALADSPDGQLIATASLDGTLRVWNIRGGLQTAQVNSHAPNITDIAVSPNGTTLSAVGGNLTVWDMNSQTIITNWNNPFLQDRSDTVNHGLFNQVTYQKENEIITVGVAMGATTSIMYVWSLNETVIDEETLYIRQGCGSIYDFSPDRTQLICIAHNSDFTMLYTMDWGDHINTQTSLEGWTQTQWWTAVDWAPLGGFIGAGQGDVGHITLRQGSDLNTVIQDYGEHGDFISDLQFSPDGRTFATTGGTNIKLWRIDGGMLWQADVEPPQIFATFSPNGQIIATNTHIYDALSGEVLLQLASRHDEINSIAFSPDSRIMFVGNSDGVVNAYSLVPIIQNTANIPTETPNTSIQNDGNCPVTRLTPTQQGIVLDGLALNVRTEESASANIATVIYGNDQFNVIATRPTCDGTILWVQIEFNGIRGWVAEAIGTDYLVEPVN